MLANRKMPFTAVKKTSGTIVHSGTTVSTTPNSAITAPGSRTSLIRRTGVERDGTMLAAAGPLAMTDVTRLTIQVPRNAVISQIGVLGRNATVTALIAETSAI